MSISTIIDALIQREGGYTNNVADKGGPTNYGITEHVARASGYSGPMQHMPLVVAEGIYRAMYWDAPKFSEVNKRLPRTAEELFDTGVNMGPSVAAKFLQRALNVLNLGTTYYANLIVDGNIGQLTLYALDQLIIKRGIENVETVLLRLLNAQQAVRYMELAEANPSQETFLYGWIMNRVGDMT